jgi:hypothetical protein
MSELVQKSDPRVLERYAALKLPGVDRRFFSPPQKIEPQEVGLDNL